jgi:hypothetical protein
MLVLLLVLLLGRTGGLYLLPPILQVPQWAGLH